jgi:antitoxin component YwqK of YwqJK toxin-antitoxin module
MGRKLIISLLLLACIKLSNGQGNDTLNKYDANGLKTGKWVGRWKETGKIANIEYYVGGKKNGMCIYYDVNGRLQNEVEYLNDSLHGLFKFYSPTGQREESEFKNGKQEGVTRYYNYKGQLTEEYEYHNNIRNGFHRIYSESGRVIMESSYVNGRENGTRRSYKDSDKREIILETDFVNDKRVEIRYYKNGKLVKTVKDDPSIPQKSVEG